MKNLFSRSRQLRWPLLVCSPSCQHPQVPVPPKISRSFVTAFSPTRSSPSAMRPRVVSVPRAGRSTSQAQDDVHDDRWRPSGIQQVR